MYVCKCYQSSKHGQTNLRRGLTLTHLYFDFSKAFDTVPHRRLLSKLESYKVSQQITDWVEAYLSNRKQRVLTEQ